MTTFREWFAENLGDYASDLANHGADSGFPCITYNSDGAEIFDKFGYELWDMLAEAAEEQGLSVPALIATFGRVDMASSLDSFKTLVVWFACEQIAYELENEKMEAGE